MDSRGRRDSNNSYSEEQIKRVLTGIGTSIEGEVDSDFLIFCPFHGNFRTPAGEIDKRTGIFYCFSCHKVVELEDYVMHVSNRTYFEAARYVKTREQSTTIEQDIVRQLEEKPMYVQFDDVLVKRLSTQAMSSPRAMRYYRGRSITEDSIKKFSLGYSEKMDMVTIPVAAPDGMTVGFVGRSVEGKEFKNTPKLPKSKVLFNLHRVKASRQVYVVESSFDAIRLDQVGMPAVATLGANVSNIQTGLLQKYFNDIIVVADNDEAGGNMKDRLIERLGSRVSVVQLDKQYKDIGDMSDEAIEEINFTFDKSIMAMLQ
jgi:DNA primase